VRGAALVKIVFGELSCAEGLGENDNVNQALMPDARFCVSMSQYALRLIYVSTDVPGMSIRSVARFQVCVTRMGITTVRAMVR
jgi:hypothetical protein